jgi:Domain of unknown function (DUF4279)
MQEKHRRVGFRVLSASLSAQEIAAHAGLLPASSGEIDEPEAYELPRTAARLETAWVVDSPLDIESALEERLDALLDIVEPYAKRLHQLGDGCLMHIFIGSDAVAHAAGCALLGPTLLERLSALPGEGVLVEAPESARHLEPTLSGEAS